MPRPIEITLFMICNLGVSDHFYCPANNDRQYLSFDSNSCNGNDSISLDYAVISVTDLNDSHQSAQRSKYCLFPTFSMHTV